MNATMLPLFNPLSKGLLEFVQAHPEYEFMVKCGSKVNPPRTIRRLAAHLKHTFKAKSFSGYRFEVTVFRPVFSPLISGYGPQYLQYFGPSSGAMNISCPKGSLELAFGGLDDTEAYVTTILTHL
jgi:hypothetical protein